MNHICIKVYHDGAFVSEPIYHYSGGSVKEYDNIDSDFICYFTLCDIVKATAKKKVSKMYFKANGRSLKNGRVLISSDMEVMEMLKYVDFGIVEIYTEHDEGELEVGDMGRDSRVIDLANDGENYLVGRDINFSDGEYESDTPSLDNLTDDDDELIEIRKKRMAIKKGKREINEAEKDTHKNCGSGAHNAAEKETVHAEYVDEEQVNETGVTNAKVVASLDEVHGDTGARDTIINEIESSHGTGDETTVNERKFQRVGHWKKKNTLFLGDAFICGPDIDFEGYESEYYDTDDEEMILQDAVDEDEDEHDTEVVDGNQEVVKYPTYDPKTEFKHIEFVKGMKFANCEELKHALKSHSVYNGLKLKTIKSEAARLLVKCFYSDTCEWRLFARPMKDEDSFQIKSLKNVHTCIKEYDAKIINSTWLATEYATKLRNNPKWKLKEFQKDVKEKYGLNVTLTQCYRAKKRALSEVEGALQEHYARLFDYAEEIERSNPGSKVIINIVPQIPLRVFRRFYVIFDGLKRGWTDNCRHVMGLDGAFLKGFCKGELLAAVGRDGNEQMFPIAWAIVESENKDSWSWFLRQLLRDLGLSSDHGGRGWTIISDQQKGLIPAIQEFLPEAEHRNCARHIYANFRKRHGGAKLRKLFWQASKCSTKEEFARTMQQIKGVSNDASSWIMNQDPHLWSRAFFDTQTNCVNVENNMSEAFNGFILEAREKPIINMLEDIRVALMIRVNKKLKDINKDPYDPICPRVRQKLENNKKNYRFWTCNFNMDHKFEVKHGEIGYVVDMATLTCSCRMWQLSGIPCEHAVNAIYFQNDSPDKYVARWYLKDTYLKTYSHYLQPMNGENMWPISSVEPVLPPEQRRARGRPKRQRRKEFHEQPKASAQISRSGKQIRCSKCHQEGHNKLTCKNDAVQITKDPPRPRGRPRKVTVPMVTPPATAPKKRGRKKSSTNAASTRVGYGIYTDVAGNTYINGFLIPNQGEGTSRTIQPRNPVNEQQQNVSRARDTTNQGQRIGEDAPGREGSTNGENTWAAF